MNQEYDWQVQQESISERAQYILKNGLWSDCNFIVGTDQCKKEFKAHKLILSMSSPVFEKMFQKCFNETNNDVEIVDIQPEAFGAMLKYVYGDKINLQSFDQACELCYIANKYMMPNLLKHCTAYIWQDVNVSNACRGYEFAKLFDQHSLMEKCKKIITQQASEVISQPSFHEVELTTLKMILEEDELNIRTEMELFDAVERWTKNEFERLGIGEADNIEKRKCIYNELVPKICFLGMQPREFAEGPALSPLLTKDQSFAILMNITSRNSECPMPKGFTTKVRRLVPEGTTRNVSLKLNLSNYTPIHNFSPTESTILFCCNKDIDILGVMLTQGCHIMEHTSLHKDSELQQPWKSCPHGLRIIHLALHTSFCNFALYEMDVFRKTLALLGPVSSPQGSFLLRFLTRRRQIQEHVNKQVTGQLPYNHQQKYKENLDIFIEDQSTNKCELSSYKSTVEYRSMIDIYFPHPTTMLHGRTYKLGIVMKQPGLYMAGTLNSWDLIHQTVKFTFVKSSEPMFIHGIILAS